MTKEARCRQLRRRSLIVAAVAVYGTTIVNASVLQLYPVAGVTGELIELAQINSKVESESEEIDSKEIDSEELQLMAHLIYAEAGSCSEEAMRYVGSVALNRVKDDCFPNTLHEVVYQKKPTIQYACIVDGNIDKEPSAESYKIAEELLRYGSEIPESVVYHAEFKQGSGIWKCIENIKFCYK